MTTAEQYWFIKNHIAFINKDDVSCEILIEPHNVCPLTNRIEAYEALNTKTQYWVELMVPYYDEDDKQWISSHDYNLDCGGDTYEEALQKLYDQVLEKYGTYTQEEGDAKFYEVNNITPNSYLVHYEHPELSKSFSQFILTEHTIENFTYMLENERNTLMALQEFKKTCTMEQMQEVLERINNTEYEIWVLEESLRTGIDVDL